MNFTFLPGNRAQRCGPPERPRAAEDRATLQPLYECLLGNGPLPTAQLRGAAGAAEAGAAVSIELQRRQAGDSPGLCGPPLSHGWAVSPAAPPPVTSPPISPMCPTTSLIPVRTALSPMWSLDMGVSGPSQPQPGDMWRPP